ncbi:DtxR family iron (metal) dependent repressor [Antricoccus suffuscus]|uniref:DtxR family iron (Metal) dependent repressor n=1 Tax=Antricoccus suffuscus TaxID=1629062 RepID=A0A2T1A4W8_9ACTN|nr:metal-dependent transcriptional regulator [Antricoccus suffuscus]PRZ43640.1 DtxR family iron (metal) dependent repressor [Antricoccus suffuscus]
MNDLIDTTEMYLKTIFELEEVGIVPLRARIAERLHQSGPTVSQTVARMQRDGLVNVEGDRHLALTEEGRSHATAVMRKHRLAELLLVEVLGLEWEKVHTEACRWEHVMSVDVEQKIVSLLADAQFDPYGNPIPGLEDLGAASPPSDTAGLKTIAQTVTADGQSVVVRRISEHLQADEDLLGRLAAGGIRPGATVRLVRNGDGIQIGETVFGPDVAEHVFVVAQ